MTSSPRLLPLLGALILCVGIPASASSDTQRLHALFERYWETDARMFPEFATLRGDHRYGDRFVDASPEAIAQRDAYYRDLAAELATFDAATLAEKDRTSLGILQSTVANQVAMQAFEGARSISVSAHPFAFQTGFVNLLRASPVDSEAQVERVLARMAAYPRRVDQEIARLRRGMESGWVPCKALLRVAGGQLERQVAARGRTSAYFEPFLRLPSTMDPALREALQTRALARIDEGVIPALQRLHSFATGDYAARAPEACGWAQYPGGDRAYAALVRIHTTTAISPDEIHALGLKKVAELRARMEEVALEAGFPGDLAGFRKHLKTDPKYFFTTPEALLAAYREISKRVDPEIPRLFAVLPRAPYGVRPLPDFVGAGVPDSYSGPALDGTTPGWFNVNLAGLRERPSWEMEALILHEAVPGHHLQIARAAEIADIPAFRRSAFFAAYGEGWALYAETLGAELGFYKDPPSRYGALQYQAWRAARLVIDTGIHSKGWSRQRAIDYLKDATGFEDAKAAAEVDRYFSWPGQALTYMIGQLRIQELRDKAAKALGARFDVRRFHNVVLDSGAVPLDVLGQLVDGWIAAELKAGSK